MNITSQSIKLKAVEFQLPDSQVTVCNKNTIIPYSLKFKFNKSTKSQNPPPPPKKKKREKNLESLLSQTFKESTVIIKPPKIGWLRLKWI